MADKPRKPGERQAGPGRFAGKPATGPARAPRQVGGVDRFALEKLAEEGMLSAEGRKLLGGEGPARKGGFKPAARGGVKLGVSRGDDVPVISTRGAEAMDEAIRTARPARAPRAEAPKAAGKADRKGARTKGPRPDEAPADRLHKVMAQSGVASRRHSEELIQAGRVTVNGKVVTELGLKVVPGRDRVEVDGRPLGQKEDMVYILLNKPKGYVTTLYDPQGRPKVTDLLGEEVAQRIYPVGRLDYDTEGLLLLTNDGELANTLMHPAREIKKTYIAKVRGVPGPAKIRELENGIELDDGPTAPAEVKLIEAKGPNAATLSIRIHEGRNRQVRRMFEAVGHEVIHLKRTTLGPLNLRDMLVGHWRELSEREVEDLKRAVGLRVQVSRGARVAAIVEQRRTGRRGAARFDAPAEGRFAGRTAGRTGGRPAGRPGAGEAGLEAPTTARGGARPPQGAGRPVRVKGPRPDGFEERGPRKGGGFGDRPREGGPRKGGGFGDRPREGGPRKGGVDFGFGDRPRTGGGPREGARGGAGFGGGPREGARGGAGFGGGPRQGARGGAGFGGPREGGRGGGRDGGRDGGRGDRGGKRR